jgi:dTDP-4-amino-4,6-dideoxy-D-galactose acyltransferase
MTLVAKATTMSTVRRPNSTESRLCQFLDWDSAFFGKRIARMTTSRVGADDSRSILEWSAAEGIDCLYFLADANDTQSVRWAESLDFQFVDVRITMVRSSEPALRESDDPFIRPACAADVSALKAIARVSHKDSRFYHDRSFPVELCDSLYETWIEKSCNGYADAVFVWEQEGVARGYASCHLSHRAIGNIGLVGVAPEAQGRRVGQKLVQEALHWFRQQKVNQVEVVTQGRNVRAQRLYQRCGFVTQSLQLWYHKWFMNQK